MESKNSEYRSRVGRILLRTSVTSIPLGTSNCVRVANITSVPAGMETVAPSASVNLVAPVNLINVSLELMALFRATRVNWTRG